MLLLIVGLEKERIEFIFHDFFYLELITVKLPAGSNFDRDVICHLGDTIIGLERKGSSQ